MRLVKELNLLTSFDMDASIEDIEDAVDHGILVSRLALLLSNELGLEKDFCKDMEIAGMIHDIGKLKLGDYLYGRRKDSLDIEELKYVRMHPTLGYEILREKKEYNERILMSVYHHHENIDGSGYPDNLKGNAIPYGAKILRPCDVFAALVSERPYRSAFDIDTTMELMIDEVKNFDMKIFLAFMRVIHSEEFEKIKYFIHQSNKRSEIRNYDIDQEFLHFYEK